MQRIRWRLKNVLRKEVRCPRACITWGEDNALGNTFISFGERLYVRVHVSGAVEMSGCLLGVLSCSQPTFQTWRLLSANPCWLMTWGWLWKPALRFPLLTVWLVVCTHLPPAHQRSAASCDEVENKNALGMLKSFLSVCKIYVDALLISTI